MQWALRRKVRKTEINKHYVAFNMSFLKMWEEYLTTENGRSMRTNRKEEDNDNARQKRRIILIALITAKNA
jgi:hypothetical protein